MKAWIILLTIAGTAMQVAALLRYLSRASRSLRDRERLVERRGYAYTSYEDVDSDFDGDSRGPLRQARDDYRVDVTLIGGGGVLLVIASIWSLYV